MALNAGIELEPRRRWAPLFCLGGAAIGVVLVIVGVSWNSLTSQDAFWSPEQAKEFQAASDALHSHDPAGTHDHAHGHADANARERFDRIAAELERARFQRDELGPLLAKVGLAAAIAFGIGYGLSQRAD